MKRVLVLIALVSLVGLRPGTDAMAAASTTLWIVTPREITAYDASTFQELRRLVLPDHVNVSMNSLGIPDDFVIDGDYRHRIWRRDRDELHEIPLPRMTPADVDSEGFTISGFHQWLGDADGRSAYVIQGTRSSSRDEGEHAVPRRSLPFDVTWVDLPTGAQAKVTEGRTDWPCTVSHEIFRDDCEPPEIWAPDGLVRECFVLTRQVPVETDRYRYAVPERTRFRKDGVRWRGVAMPDPAGAVLMDMTADGSAWIEAVPDGGCCAEVNAGNDQLRWSTMDTSIVVFDESSRFRNGAFEIGFSPGSARISPHASRLAYTIEAVAAGDTFRVVLGDPPVPDPVQSIRDHLAEMPRVEIVDVRDTPLLSLSLPRSVLVGWVSDSEVLVIHERRLVSVDVVSGARRESTIKVSNPYSARVIWR